MRAALALAVILFACGDDAGAPADAAPADAGIDSGRRPRRDAGPPVCGDGRIQPGESCDDENLVPGDGCSPECRWGPRCGDGTADEALGEVCDDGARAAGDGCAPTCASREECGDGIRDAATAEVCDDGNDDPGDGCDCLALAGCGDGTLDGAAGEVCDDGNLAYWDGCGRDCRPEVSLVIQALQVAEPGAGCDWTGDGVTENRLGLALGAIRPPFNTIIRNRLVSGTGLILLHLDHLDDPSAENDGELRVVWLVGVDPAMTPEDNFSGVATFHIAGDGYTDLADGRHRASRSLRASVVDRVLTGGEEDFVMRLPLNGPPPAPPYDIPFTRMRLHAITEASSGPEANALREGLLCGVISAKAFHGVNHPLLAEGAGDGCDDTSTRISFADITASGTMVLGIASRPTQPDVDLDGDGLEQLEVDDAGAPECHPVISACIDGDGTRIEGHDCPLDPRIADGWSAAVVFEAVGAVIDGIEP